MTSIIWSASYASLSIWPHLYVVPNPLAPRRNFALQAGAVWMLALVTFGGVSYADPAAFAGLAGGARKLAPLLRDWMAQGRVGGEACSGGWRDIGTVDRHHASWIDSSSLPLINFEVLNHAYLGKVLGTFFDFARPISSAP